MKEKICLKQFFKLMVVYIIANDTVRGIYAHDLKQDVWIPQLIGVLISVLLFTLYLFIYKNTKFNDFDNSMKHVLGKFVSKIIYVLYIIYFLAIIFFNLTDMQEIIILHLLPGYSDIMLNLIMLGAILYLLSKKVEVLARLSELVFLGIIAIFIAMIVFSTSIHVFNFNNVLPILNKGYLPIVRPAIEMGYSVPFGELFVMLVIFQHLDNKEKYTKVGTYSILTASFILTTVTLLNIFIIGPYAMSYGLSPAFRLARMIDIEEYLQRLDLLLIGYHMIVVFVKIIVLLYGASIMVRSIFKLKEKQTKYSNLILVAIVFVATLFLTKSYTDILVFRRDFFIKYIGLIMEVFFPLLIVIISFARKGKKIVNPNDLLEFEI